MRFGLSVFGRPSSARKGFTLIELVLYIAISSLLLIVLTGIFMALSQSWLRSRARARVEENLRFAIQAIQESVASAEEIIVPAPSAGADTLTLVLPPSSGDNQSYFGWVWSEQLGWISFNCKNPDATSTSKADPFDCTQDKLLPKDGTGTIKTNSGSAFVFGTGTIFKKELAVGDTIFSAGQTVVVSAIANDGLSVASPAFSPALPLGTTFTYIKPNQFTNYLVKRSGGVLSGYAVNCPNGASLPDQPCYPVSFNCKDASAAVPSHLDLCGESSYRVTVDGSGVYHGWAWGGEVLGWLSFNCDNTSSCSTVDYKVTETRSTSGAELFGWAWSENAGWLSFNCKDREAATPGICTASPYSVTTGFGGALRYFTVDASNRVTRQDSSGTPSALTASTVKIEKCSNWTNYFQHFANPPDPRAGVTVCFKASYNGVASFLFPYSTEQQESIQLHAR